MLIVLKSGRLNLLEPSGPVQACKGIAPLRLKNEGSKFEMVVHTDLTALRHIPEYRHYSLKSYTAHVSVSYIL